MVAGRGLFIHDVAPHDCVVAIQRVIYLNLSKMATVGSISINAQEASCQ
jgi:hypothetical protein